MLSKCIDIVPLLWSYSGWFYCENEYGIIQGAWYITPNGVLGSFYFGKENLDMERGVVKVTETPYAYLILHNETYKKYGYWPQNLCAGVNKKIILRCLGCGEQKETECANFSKGNCLYHPRCKNIKRKQTCLKKFGVEHHFQLTEMKEQRKQTNLAKYGVEHVSQVPEIREKQKRSTLKRYGVEYSLASPEVQEKSRQTNLKRYGVENVSQAPKIRKKTMKTWLAKYGVDNPRKAEVVKEKIKKVHIAKYGVPYYNQQIWLERGCKDVSSESIIDYIRQQVEQEKYKLLSTDYKSSLSKLEMECPQGHKCLISWTDWNWGGGHGIRCAECLYKHQTKLGEILRELYGEQVSRQSNLGCLGEQKVDFAIIKRKLAIEYDGEQHFQPIEHFGGKKRFKYLQRLDARKNRILKRNGWRLVRIKYDELLEKEHIEKRCRCAG